MKNLFKFLFISLLIIFSITFYLKEDIDINIPTDGLVKEPSSNTNPKPSHLTVYNLYKEKGLQKVCEDFGESIKDEPHKNNWQLYPYKIDDDMDILNAKQLDDGWEFEISCSIKASYQLNAVTHLYENFNKNLGKIKYLKR